jgi:ATP-binding cassette, subfamily C, bacterial exporter for protease/lipase
LKQSSNDGLMPVEFVDALKPFRSAAWTLAVFSVVLNLLMLVPAIYMLQVYDRVLASRNVTTLVMVTLLAVGLYLLMALVDWSRGMVMTRVGDALDAKLSPRVYEAAYQKNLAEGGGGNAGQALTDFTTVRQFAAGQGFFAFLDAPWFPIYLAIIFHFDWRLGIFSAVGALILVALAVLNAVITRSPMQEAGQHAAKSSQMTTTGLRNAEVIESMGMLRSLQQRWNGTHSRWLAAQRDANEKASAVQSSSKSVRLALQSGILGYGALLAINGDITPGMMIAASILMGRALAPVDALIGVWRQFGPVKISYQRLCALFNEHPARSIGMSLPEPEGHVRVEQAFVGPPASRNPVLKGISLTIAPGQILGVIGPSGSGKSTLARALIGIWRPMGGTVRLDGADVAQWDKTELGPFLGYLPQDIELFAGSISENISRFGEVESTKVVAAARLAGVHEMILQLPKGYDTHVGEGGAGLSGGQRQRVALARAVYGLPKLVVLDEPNSNLDDVGQSALAAALRQLAQLKRTVVVITHHPAVLRVTTHLAVVKDGHLQMYGPTAKVMGELAALKKPGGANANGASDKQDPGQLSISTDL